MNVFFSQLETGLTGGSPLGGAAGEIVEVIRRLGGGVNVRSIIAAGPGQKRCDQQNA